MAIYPGARKQLIPAGSNDPAIIPIGVILHVDAGNVGNLHDYFDGPSGGIESHFHFPKVGAPYQYRDTSREADANYRANSFLKDGKRYGFISVETQGLERGEWNAHQLAELKKFLLWCHKTHGIPLRKCPAWNAAGIGYHVMFGAPGPWTPVAKSCPGPDRVRQFNNVLVPWFKNATAPGDTKPPTSTGDDMPLTDADKTWLRANMDDSESDYAVRFWVAPTGTGTALINTVKEIALTVARIEDDTDQVAAIQAKVAEVDASLDAMKADALQKRQALQALEDGKA